MFDSVLSFIDRHNSFILTTHDPADADGLGAQLVFTAILKKAGKNTRIINASAVPPHLTFMVNDASIEKLDHDKHSSIFKDSALFVLDTCEEHQLGSMRETLSSFKEIFIFDHHEPKPRMKLTGFIDQTAASTSELAIELAACTGTELDKNTATAAYAGIVYDTGFFAYPKTNIRTFKAAIKTIEWGTALTDIYRQLMENYSCAAVLLQKQALSNLDFYANRKIALLQLFKEDYKIAGADFNEADNIVNIPLKAREVEVSVLIRETETNEIRCSLRSKGIVNVSKIAQSFGGGGHVTAAGFKSNLSMKEIRDKLLDDIETWLLTKK